MSDELSDAQIILFHKLDTFAADNSIDLLAFWKTNRLCLTLQQFLELTERIGLQVTHGEQQSLEREGVEFINLESILKNVQNWRKVDKSVSDFLSRQEKQKEEASSRQPTKKVRDSRTKTNSSFGEFKDSRVKAAERQWRQEVKLNQTLIRAKNQSDYELTIKVGQANDICKKLKNDCSYIIDSGNGQLKIIEVKVKTGEQVEISRKIFEKKYEQLKIASLARGEEVEGTLEEDLKKVLVQVMYLSGQLQEQIKLLEAKGVTH